VCPYCTGILSMDTITSTRNPRIVDARKLDQRKHRQEQGRFAVEGLQLLGMALDGGYTPQEVFYAPDLFTGETAPALLKRFGQPPPQLVEGASEVMRARPQRDTPKGIVATFRLPSVGLESVQRTGAELAIVPDRVRAPGHVGTILRTADAVGAGAV